MLMLNNQRAYHYLTTKNAHDYPLIIQRIHSPQYKKYSQKLCVRKGWDSSQDAPRSSAKRAGPAMLGCSVSIAVVRADQWYGCVTKIRQNTTKPGNFEGYTVYIDMSYSIIQPYEVYGILVPFLQHLQQTWHMVKLYLYLLHGTKVWSTYVGKRLKTWGNMSIHLDVL